MKIIYGRRTESEIKVANLITKKIHEHLKSQKKIILGIPGGKSVSNIFSLLKHQNIPWEKVHIFMIDERLSKTDDSKSNFKQAEKEFLEYLVKQNKIPRTNLHPYTYFNFPDEKGIQAYRNELKEISDKYDIILLSSGEDGHVASLYPNHESIKDQSEFFIIVKNSPKPPPKRLSASRKLLTKSKTSILLFFGESKKLAFKNFRDNYQGVYDCPAKLINLIEDSYVFTDLST